MHSYNLKFNKAKNLETGTVSRFLFGILLGVFSLYLYYVQGSVINVVQREGLNREIAMVGAEVSKLEAEYIKIRSAINMDTAKVLGFGEDFNNINFANVDSGNAAGGLSYVNNEI